MINRSIHNDMKVVTITMLFAWDIESIIKTILEQHQLDLNFEIKNDLSAPMSYNLSTKTIKFNYLEINGFIAKTKVTIKETDENLVKIILYRQIGYFLDHRKNKHDLRTLMYGDEHEKVRLIAKIETNSWEYGRSLVPEQLLNSYDKVRNFEKF